MIENYVITIDGPAGSGKSTLAKMLAQSLGITYLDTGGMYRAATWHVLHSKIDEKDEAKILRKTIINKPIFFISKLYFIYRVTNIIQQNI